MVLTLDRKDTEAAPVERTDAEAAPTPTKEPSRLRFVLRSSDRVEGADPGRVFPAVGCGALDTECASEAEPADLRLIDVLLTAAIWEDPIKNWSSPTTLLTSKDEPMALSFL